MMSSMATTSSVPPWVTSSAPSAASPVVIRATAMRSPAS